MNRFQTKFLSSQKNIIKRTFLNNIINVLKGPNENGIPVKFDLHAYLFNMNKWKQFSDKEYGGNSTSHIQQVTEANKTFIRFSGQINFVTPQPTQNAHSDVKSNDIKKPEASVEISKPVRGYSAIKCNFDSVLDLRDMQGIEIEIRSNKKQILKYNISCLSFFGDDIYQVYNTSK